MNGEAIVTKAALARAIGRSSARVSQFIQEGKLAPPALLPDGRVDLALAVEQLRPFLGDASAPREIVAATPAPPSAMASAKLRQAEAAAARAELDLAVAQRTLERELMAGVIAYAKDVGGVIVELLDGRRDHLASAVHGASGISAAREVIKQADLKLRRDFGAAVEREGFRLGLWSSPEEFQAAVEAARLELDG